ncbi:UMP-CMP kinase 2, mitochondrial [Pogona vitticeps]
MLPRGPRAFSQAAATALRPPSGGAPERLCVAELPGSELAYFAEGGGGGGRPPRGFLPPPGRCFSFCVPSGPSAGERVRAARLLRRAEQRLSREPFGPGEVLPLLAYAGPPGSRPEKGFLVRDRRRLPETERALEDLVRLVLPPPARLLSVYEAAAAEDGGGPLWRSLWRLQGAPESKVLLGRARVAGAEEPALHPAAAHLLDGAAVFASFEAARAILTECLSVIPEAKAVLDLVDGCPVRPKKGDFPVIVIEGLDATGKTTVTHALKDSLNAVLLRSPPPCVSQWRKVFDDEPTLIRRAFYALTNYIVASEIAEQSTKSPVIVDRFWHSTAAYAIATEISGKIQHLPPVHHPVYRWPGDLLKPDLVLLLTVSPEERIRRLQGRGIEKTREEAELEANNVFRQKVEESYLRMENPACQPVDASPSREEVLKTVHHLIKKQCHFP